MGNVTREKAWLQAPFLSLRTTGVCVEDGVFCSGKLFARPMTEAARPGCGADAHVTGSASDQREPNRVA